jgi:uncharacterized membrane protein (UPF0182 family)
MAVDADAASKDYGTIRLLRVTSTVRGPQQVQSELNSNADVAEFVRNLRGTDSDIEYGNLLTVPLNGGFLYIEPVYARGGTSNYPLLRKVGVAYGDQTVFKDTLAEGLNTVFGVDGEETTEPPPKDGETPKPPATGDTDLAKAIADAEDAYKAGEEALKKGDWDAYGKAQEDLQDAIQRASEAEQKASSASGANGDADKEASGQQDGDQGS